MDDGKPTLYVKCGNCGTVYASPRASYESRYAWLDSHFGYGKNAVQNAESRQQALAKEAGLLQNHIAGGKLLDVGCDLGYLFHWFPSPDWERYGVELSPSAATFASQNYAAQVNTGTIRQAAYSDKDFDLVTMLDTLYYLDDPQSDLREIHRILKPNGILAIEITGQAYQMLRSRGLICWILENRWTRLQTDSSYINWISPSGLRLLLTSCGFEVCQYYIISSPTSLSRWRSIFSTMHQRLSQTFMKWSFQSLTWAPKYLVLANRSI
jgi:SAM-dependent methyltransferase